MEKWGHSVKPIATDVILASRGDVPPHVPPLATLRTHKGQVSIVGVVTPLIVGKTYITHYLSYFYAFST